MCKYFFCVFYGPGGCFEWSNLNNVTAGNLKLSAIIPDDVSNEVVDCCRVSQSVDIPVCGHPTSERCMGFIFTTYLPIFVAQHRFSTCSWNPIFQIRSCKLLTKIMLNAFFSQNSHLNFPFPKYFKQISSPLATGPGCGQAVLPALSWTAHRTWRSPTSVRDKRQDARWIDWELVAGYRWYTPKIPQTMERGICYDLLVYQYTVYHYIVGFIVLSFLGVCCRWTIQDKNEIIIDDHKARCKPRRVKRWSVVNGLVESSFLAAMMSRRLVYHLDRCWATRSP